MTVTTEIHPPDSNEGLTDEERLEIAEEIGQEAVGSMPVGVQEYHTVGEIDVSHNAERKAYALAGRQVEKLKEENAQRFIFNPKRIGRAIWGYKADHRKALTQARQDIQQAGDVNAGDEDFDTQARARYGDVIFEQFFHGSDEAIDKAAGEQREFFAGDHEATLAAKQLYSEYVASEDMTDDEFNRRLQEVRAKMGGQVSETATGEVVLSNYLEVAQAMRGRRQHGEGLESIITGFRLMRGEARSDSRTEIHRTKVDKLLDTYEDSRFGRLIPSTVLANGIAIGSYLATRGATTVARATTFVGGGAVIGAVAGAREHADITRQRALRSQEIFRGREFINSTQRERELAAFEYSRRNVDSLLDEFDMSLESLREGRVDAATIDAVLDQLATTQLLKELSAEKGVDLFDHGPSDDPNKHLMDRIALAQAQSELKMLLAGAIDRGDLDLARFGLDDLSDFEGDAAEFLDSLLQGRAISFQDEYLDDISSKDLAFHKYRRRESIKKGIKVGAFSLVAGAAIQEAYSMVSDHSSGLVEQAWDADNNVGAHNTMLGSLHPEVQNASQFFDRELTPSEIADFQKAGSTIIDHSFPGLHLESGSTTLHDYVAAHSAEMRHFESVELYTNRINGISDLNELGGQLSHGSDGSVRVWDTMTASGSFNATHAIDMDAGPNVFDIALKQPDGSYLHKVFNYGQDVPKPWADMLYEKDNGTWGFKGDGYIAWGQTSGDHLDVAASIAGDGEDVTVDTTKFFESTEPLFEVVTNVETPTDFAPPVWFSQTERLGRTRRPSRYSYEGGYGGGYDRASRKRSAELLEIMRGEGLSPVLERSPRAILRPREELDRYRAEVERRRGANAVASIKQMIQQTPELSIVDNNLETIVTMPVGAAYESENIFNTLSLYAQQDPESLKKTVLLLNVNWLNSIESDGEQMEKVQKTLSEIDRAKQQFPQLIIAVIQNVYDTDQVNSTGGVIGYVAQDLVDTALLTIQKHMEDGTIPDDKSILIQRHDADMLGMGRGHLAALQKSAERYPETDLFRGTTRFDVRQSEQYPGWGITSDIVNMSSLWAIQKGSVRTGGANFAVRAETLAAIGGLGDLKKGRFGSRAGSDDVAIGERVAAARNPERPTTLGLRGSSYSTDVSYTTIDDESDGDDRRIMRHVAGMTIDTNSDRFLPIYLRGDDWNSAWSPGEGSFDQGEGGYGARDKEAARVKGARTASERYGLFNSPDFERLEQTLSRELSYQDASTRQRTLALFFRDVPGAYRLHAKDDGGVTLEFTRAGRRFVRQRIKRGLKPYGRKKIEGLYGDERGVSPLGQRAPLVAAAT